MTISRRGLEGNKNGTAAYSITTTSPVRGCHRGCLLSPVVSAFYDPSGGSRRGVDEEAERGDHCRNLLVMSACDASFQSPNEQNREHSRSASNMKSGANSVNKAYDGDVRCVFDVCSTS